MSQIRSSLWTKEKVVAEIKKLRLIGEQLSSAYIARVYPRLSGGARMAFGSWKKAIEAAGIEYVTISRRAPTENWTKEKIISRIQKRANEGKPINMWVMKNNERALYTAAYRYFGNWGNAIEAAGFSHLEIRTDKKWTAELVIRAIKRKAKRGEPISLLYMRKTDESLYMASVRYCGGWKKAVETAGFSYNKIVKNKKWSKELIVKEMQKRHSDGLPLNAKSVEQENHNLYNRAIYHFDDWEAAITAAGFSYDQVVRRWIFRSRASHLRSFTNPRKE